MEKRNRSRMPKRLTCEIVWQGQRHPGIVRDITDRGLFVQTLASPAPNSVVEIRFAATGLQPEIRLEAGVARKRIAPPRLQASVPSGIGLEILPPRDEYERWLVRPACPPLAASSFNEGPDASAAEPSVRPYRVRMVRRDRGGRQILTIRSQTDAAARAQALARAGAGWKIADIQPL